MAKDNDVIKVIKTILMWVSSFSLVITLIKISELQLIFMTTLTYFASNCLTFYGLECQNEGAEKRRRWLLKIYLVSIVLILFLWLIYTNFLDYNFVKLISYVFRTVFGVVSFVAPFFATLDHINTRSLDFEKRKDLANEYFDTKDYEDKFKEKHKNEDNNIKTKQFLVKNQKKIKRRG